jgi:hypothetical protein
MQSWGRKRKEKKPVAKSAEATGPLAALRRGRGWIDHVDERELWDMLIQVRWPGGPACPCCGEREPRYLESVDPDYRGGLGRWRCQVCAEAGDPGEGGTFTPLTGTLLEGMRIDIRTLWLIVELFADGKASVEASQEAGVNRHTTGRWFRLLRAAIYQARSAASIVLEAEDIAEFDEVYTTAGLKGRAGGLELERVPRKRGLKRRGRGTWDNDRLPVFGLVCRGERCGCSCCVTCKQRRFVPSCNRWFSEELASTRITIASIISSRKRVINTERSTTVPESMPSTWMVTASAKSTATR